MVISSHNREVPYGFSTTAAMGALLPMCGSMQLSRD